MKPNNCPAVDRREAICPMAEQIAEDAASKAVRDLFSRLGYDINNAEDAKKLVLLFDFLDRTSANVDFGKKIAYKTIVVTVVLGILGMIGLHIVKGN